MSPDATLLDLADISGWLATTKRIVNRLVPKRIRTDLKNFNPDKMYGDTMSFLIDCGIRNGECLDVEDWSADFDAAFLDCYTHIRGFHSCRAFAGLHAYRTLGIRKLSRTLLRELAHAVFCEQATQVEIDAVVDEANIPDFDKSVYLFTDSTHPLDSSCNYYLQSGSEMLQVLSIKLGIHSRRILAAQGQPYLIECEVPLQHVSQGSRWELWRKFVTEHFRIAAGDAPPTEPYDFCIRVTESIAPSSIREFHRIDDANIESVAPPH